MSSSVENVSHTKKILTQVHPSPENSFSESAQTGDRPGFIPNKQGMSWSGMMDGQTLLENGGKTYGDTNIDVTKSDTRIRVDRAKKTVENQPFYQMSFLEQALLLDQFAQRIHQPDVVGSYFPEVLKLQAEQKKIIETGMSLVLSPAESKHVEELHEARVTQNQGKWARRDKDGSVQNQAVVEIEDTNAQTDLNILEVKRQAAYNVLGSENAAKIEEKARVGVNNLNPVEKEERVVSSLMEEAGKSKLTDNQKQELSSLKAREDKLWDEKGKQSDFSDAIRDGNPDCSEYASLTAVSLAGSGIKNMRVMGHVLEDDRFATVGAHAYNVILDKSGQNIVGVFEGTATSGTFKKVMNNVSLDDFKNGSTLVTFNPDGGWATYGTGAPAKGQDLLGFVKDPDRPGQEDLVTNIIERRDVNAMAKAKVDYMNTLNPEVVADQVIDIYKQYGDRVKVQGWIDDIRDGTTTHSNDANPALAQAAQILQDYKGTLPPPAKIRDRIIEIVKDSHNRATENGNYNLAITPQALHRLDDPASENLANDLKQAISKMSADQIAKLSEDKPWIAQVASLSEKVKNIPYTSYDGSKSAFDYAEQGDKSYLEAYGQIASIVRAKNITEHDLKEVQSSISMDNNKPAHTQHAHALDIPTR